MPKYKGLQLFILRLQKQDQFTEEGSLGSRLWHESSKDPSIITTLAPLSDIYYDLIQTTYCELSCRKNDFARIDEQMNKYMAWGTFPCLNRGK